MDLILYFLLMPYAIVQIWWRLLTPKRELANAKNTHCMSLNGTDSNHFFCDNSSIFLQSQKKISVTSDTLYMRDVAKEK